MDKTNTVILLVEDNRNVLHLNRSVLVRQGFEICCAENLKQAREVLSTHPDLSLAVLDIILPDGSGLEFAAEIKQLLNCPVLMLTSKRSTEEIVAGLTSAADDYMTKPYRIEELIGRIQALLQKQRATDEKSVVCGPLLLDLPASRAYLHENDLLLSPREFAVLLYLIRHEGDYVSADMLYEAAWKLPVEGSNGTVKTTVSRLRHKIEGSGCLIESGRGSGYRLKKD